MVYDPRAYQSKIAEYLNSMGYGNYDPNAGASAPGGMSTGASLAGLAGVIGAKYAASEYLKPFLKDNITGPLKEYLKSKGLDLKEGISSLFGGSSAAESTLPAFSIGAEAPSSVLNLGGLGSSAASSAADAGIPAFSLGAEAPSSMLGVSSDFGSLGAAGAAEPTTISNFAGSATPVLGAAGTALGAYQAFQGIKDKNPLGAGLGGLGAGLGINAMGFGLGPPGWAAMIAAPVAASLINKYTDRDEWKGERDRARKLQEQGINMPSLDFLNTLQGGRTKEQLLNPGYAKDFVGYGNGGEFVNNLFSQSRKESDLRPEDIQGYSFLPEKFGKAYADLDLAKRLDVGKMLLDAGAVREAKGQMDLNENFTADLDKKIRDYLAGAANG